MKKMVFYLGFCVLPVVASAASLCSGNSAGVAVDTTAGTRTAAVRETIRYGATWETMASGATVLVAVNGTTLKSATGTGSVVWTPPRDGTYTLTHRVMNGDEQIGETLTPYQLSSGEKQMLVILLTVLVEDQLPYVLFMDEPEVSLHVEWQKRLIDLILSLNPNVQIILTTHSPAVVMNGWMDKVTEVSDIVNDEDFS